MYCSTCSLCITASPFHARSHARRSTVIRRAHTANGNSIAARDVEQSTYRALFSYGDSRGYAGRVPLRCAHYSPQRSVPRCARLPPVFFSAGAVLPQLVAARPRQARARLSSSGASVFSAFRREIHRLTVDCSYFIHGRLAAVGLILSLPFSRSAVVYGAAESPTHPCGGGSGGALGAHTRYALCGGYPAGHSIGGAGDSRSPAPASPRAASPSLLVIRHAVWHTASSFIGYWLAILQRASHSRRFGCVSCLGGRRGAPPALPLTPGHWYPIFLWYMVVVITRAGAPWGQPRPTRAAATLAVFSYSRARPISCLGPSPRPAPLGACRRCASFWARCSPSRSCLLACKRPRPLAASGALA